MASRRTMFVSTGRAAARRFEVDDVQPRAARDVERIENRLGIAVGRHVREVAAQQADDVAAEEIERRDHVHAMKFLSTRSPAARRFLGMKLHAEDAVALHRGGERAAVVGARDLVRRVRSRRRS